MRFAKWLDAGSPETLSLLIRALARVLQSQAIIEPLLHMPRDNGAHSIDQNWLFDTHFPLDKEGRSFYEIARRLPIRSTKKLRLGIDAVLPWPWSPERLANAMDGLRPGGPWGPWKAEINHHIELWQPIGLGWVHGGNHSLAVGILTASGSVRAQSAYDITSIYKHVACDGVVFRRRHDRHIISVVTSVELAAIFEIGRLLCAKAGAHPT
jgi:hypothetical protein